MLKHLPGFHDFFGDTDKYFVGYEDTFKRLNDFGTNFSKTLSSNWPPFNIKQDPKNENHYTIELAVAGFAKQDLDITMQDGTLTVSGKTASDEEGDKDNYLFKGIAERSFTRSFSLADTVEVKDAKMVNGMLKIYLDNMIPLQKAAKKIAINAAEAISGAQQLLNEAKDKSAI